VWQARLLHKTASTRNLAFDNPPEQLSTLLEAAMQAWDAGQQQEARALLQQVVPLAEQMGYL